MSIVFNELVKKNAKIIVGYHLIETTLFVCHGSIVSTFGLQGLDFKVYKHFDLKKEINQSFRVSKGPGKKHMIGFVFEDGFVNFIDSDRPNGVEFWEIQQDKEANLPGDHLVSLQRDY